MVTFTFKNVFDTDDTVLIQILEMDSTRSALDTRVFMGRFDFNLFFG